VCFNTNTHMLAIPCTHTHIVPGVFVISCLECCLGLCSICSRESVKEKGNLRPKRTGNLISALSSFINLPSGTSTINKDPTLCDTFLDRWWSDCPLQSSDIFNTCSTLYTCRSIYIHLL